MALDATQVRVAITGAAYTAPTGTALPTTAVMALNAAFLDVGYISEDGVTETYDEDQEVITAWQNGAVVRRVTTESSAEFAFTMIETKETSLELYHKAPGGIVSDGGTGYKLEVKASNVDRRRFVLDVVDGSDVIRIVIPDGEVTEREEITYANGEPVGYGVTITGYPDSNNVVAIKYSNSADWAVA